jgi:hypothetical protein
MMKIHSLVTTKKRVGNQRRLLLSSRRFIE